jgi:hypothetical protein
MMLGQRYIDIPQDNDYGVPHKDGARRSGLIPNPQIGKIIIGAS